jgi:hypothetical protein
MFGRDALAWAVEKDAARPGPPMVVAGCSDIQISYEERVELEPDPSNIAPISADG